MKSFARRLVLRQRQTRTRKWAINWLVQTGALSLDRKAFYNSSLEERSCFKQVLYIRCTFFIKSSGPSWRKTAPWYPFVIFFTRPLFIRSQLFESLEKPTAGGKWGHRCSKAITVHDQHQLTTLEKKLSGKANVTPGITQSQLTNRWLERRATVKDGGTGRALMTGFYGHTLQLDC